MFHLISLINHNISLGSSDSNYAQIFVTYFLESLFSGYSILNEQICVYFQVEFMLHFQAKSLKSFPDSAILTTSLWGKHVYLLFPCRKGNKKSKTKHQGIQFFAELSVLVLCPFWVRLFVFVIEVYVSLFTTFPLPIPGFLCYREIYRFDVILLACFCLYLISCQCYCEEISSSNAINLYPNGFTLGIL